MLRIRLPGRTFGDIQGNRGRGTPELVGQIVSFLGRKLLCKIVGRVYIIDSPLPHLPFFKLESQ